MSSEQINKDMDGLDPGSKWPSALAFLLMRRPGHSARVVQDGWPLPADGRAPASRAPSEDEGTSMPKAEQEEADDGG